MVFAFLFGLSMDYEVFILSRIREEYDAHRLDATGGRRRARPDRAAGHQRGGDPDARASCPCRPAGMTDLKILATGLGAGILVDAVVVRCLLVPAMVALFGQANRWPLLLRACGLAGGGAVELASGDCEGAGGVWVRQVGTAGPGGVRLAGSMRGELAVPSPAAEPTGRRVATGTWTVPAGRTCSAEAPDYGIDTPKGLVPGVGQADRDNLLLAARRRRARRRTSNLEAVPNSYLLVWIEDDDYDQLGSGFSDAARSRRCGPGPLRRGGAGRWALGWAWDDFALMAVAGGPLAIEHADPPGAPTRTVISNMMSSVPVDKRVRRAGADA